MQTALRVLKFARPLWALAAWMLVLSAGPACRPSQAQAYSVLYSFTGSADGSNPLAGVIMDQLGNLYGTTVYGGSNPNYSGNGVVFKVDPLGHETVLHTFTGYPHDGFQPLAGLVLDGQGNLYGTTAFGGAHNSGVLFKVDTAGNYGVLYTFTGGADGHYPAQANLIMDTHGNLYGTTAGGGSYGKGVVFKLDPSGNETVLYSFTGGADGNYPVAGLIMDKLGNLYGTTNAGGHSYGVVFKLDSSGNETVLHTFTHGSDGAWPYAGLLLDGQGNLYGTTAGGGSYGKGVVFKLDPSGNFNVLYAFTGGSDGSGSQSSLIEDYQGNLYGTAGGGVYGNGVVFELDPSGNETVLHSFDGSDGAAPYAGVIQDSQGNLYGTAYLGGDNGHGVIFKIEPTSGKTVMPSLRPSLTS